MHLSIASTTQNGAEPHVFRSIFQLKSSESTVADAPMAMGTLHTSANPIQSKPINPPFPRPPSLLCLRGVCVDPRQEPPPSSACVIGGRSIDAAGGGGRAWRPPVAARPAIGGVLRRVRRAPGRTQERQEPLLRRLRRGAVPPLPSSSTATRRPPGTNPRRATGRHRLFLRHDSSIGPLVSNKSIDDLKLFVHVMVVCNGTLPRSGSTRPALSCALKTSNCSTAPASRYTTGHRGGLLFPAFGY